MGLFRHRRRAINLALQGGGAHGAFTWGVLDRLLEDPSIKITSISGTSAGAVNGVALAAGFAENGGQGARDKLRAIWQGVGEFSGPEISALSPFSFGLDAIEEVAGASVKTLTKMFSPAELNPLNIDPLRKLIETHIDFAHLRKHSKIELYIAATEAVSGRARIFELGEMTADVVLASACLPTIHHAVEINGVDYWDGGFSANPDLCSLIERSKTRDSLLVQLNPMRLDEVPESAAGIAAHMSDLTFNQPLRFELERIRALRGVKTGWLAASAPRLRRYRQHRFHHIDGAKHTVHLPPGSKARPDKSMLKELFMKGYNDAAKWLDRHGKDIGRRSSVSIKALLNGRTRSLSMKSQSF